MSKSTLIVFLSFFLFSIHTLTSGTERIRPIQGEFINLSSDVVYKVVTLSTPSQRRGTRAVRRQGHTESESNSSDTSTSPANCPKETKEYTEATEKKSAEKEKEKEKEREKEVLTTPSKLSSSTKSVTEHQEDSDSENGDSDDDGDVPPPPPAGPRPSQKQTLASSAPTITRTLAAKKTPQEALLATTKKQSISSSTSSLRKTQTPTTTKKIQQPRPIPKPQEEEEEEEDEEESNKKKEEAKPVTKKQTGLSTSSLLPTRKVQTPLQKKTQRPIPKPQEEEEEEEEGEREKEDGNKSEDDESKQEERSPLPPLPARKTQTPTTTKKTQQPRPIPKPQEEEKEEESNKKKEEVKPVTKRQTGLSSSSLLPTRKVQTPLQKKTQRPIPKPQEEKEEGEEEADESKQTEQKKKSPQKVVTKKKNPLNNASTQITINTTTETRKQAKESVPAEQSHDSDSDNSDNSDDNNFPKDEEANESENESEANNNTKSEKEDPDTTTVNTKVKSQETEREKSPKPAEPHKKKKGDRSSKLSSSMPLTQPKSPTDHKKAKKTHSKNNTKECTPTDEAATTTDVSPLDAEKSPKKQKGAKDEKSPRKHKKAEDTKDDKPQSSKKPEEDKFSITGNESKPLRKAKLYYESVMKAGGGIATKDDSNKGGIKAIGNCAAWVPDENSDCCTLCGKTFTVVVRRHHCRKCGGLFCGDCTTWRLEVPELQIKKPVRVCVKCFILLSEDKGDSTLLAASGGGTSGSLLAITNDATGDNEANDSSSDSDDGKTFYADENLPEDKEERLRLKCMREIITTEKAYVDDLNVLVNVFFYPIKFTNVLTPEQVTGLFSNVEMLEPLHKEIYEKIKSASSESAIGSAYKTIVNSQGTHYSQIYSTFTFMCTVPIHENVHTVLLKLRQGIRAHGDAQGQPGLYENTQGLPDRPKNKGPEPPELPHQAHTEDMQVPTALPRADQPHPRGPQGLCVPRRGQAGNRQNRGVRERREA